MREHELEIVIEDFRSVKSAKISIDGITVLAGENGCGKSTISKLVYYLYKTIDNYDNLIGKNLVNSLTNVFTFYEIVIQESFSDSQNRLLRNELRRELTSLKNYLENEFDGEHSYQIMLNFLNKFRYSWNKENNLKNYSDRLNFIAKDIIFRSSDWKSKEFEGLTPFESVQKFTENTFKEYSNLGKSRSSKIFKNELRDVFHESELPSKFQVYEYGTEIISFTKNHLSIPYYIQNVLYIDTPMMLGVDTYTQAHWEHLNEQIIIDINNSSKKTNHLSELIKNDVLKGEASYEVNMFSEDFSFKRADGKIFNLLDCATGVKSFSILQMLLKNGHLDGKTLLIIDEPESHLHPQWIIEYARFIVLINKHFGVKFLLASHNPDMVSALKHIAAKEDVQNILNYYLAESDKNYMYTFRHLKQNIEPIFESFNIAFDRMEMYGDSSD